MIMVERRAILRIEAAITRACQPAGASMRWAGFATCARKTAAKAKEKVQVQSEITFRWQEELEEKLLEGRRRASLRVVTTLTSADVC